jgi:probable selenium-dependent hydroxylase accessory protein YqeC
LKYITFVGAGGKTSLIEHMARGVVEAGKTVAIATTTKIYVQEPYRLMDGSSNPEEWEKPFVRVGKTLQGEKLTGVDFQDIIHLGRLYDVVLTEADGARGKPLKFPAPHEPVIPPFTDWVFVVAGFDALSGAIEDTVFRWELFCAATAMDGRSIVTPEVFSAFFSDTILLKGVDKTRFTAVLNKCDTLMAPGKATELARNLISAGTVPTVIVSSTLHHSFYEISRF